MMNFKNDEITQEETSEEFDYMNEEPLDVEENDEYEEQDDTYCD